MFDSCTDDLRESAEEVGARCRELVATDETTLVSEPLPDTIVVKDSEGDGRFSDSPCTDESHWSEGFCETDNLLDQFVTSETSSRWRGRHFSGRDAVQE